MLFHVTMTHSEDNCPAYDHQRMAEFIADGESRIEQAATDSKAKILFWLWGAPEHIAFALIEADNYAAVARIVFALPLKQDVKVTPVQNLTDVIEMGKQMMAARA